MGRRSVLVAILLLAGLGSASAQWEGTLKADGAWNMKQSNNENVDFKLKYKGDKFYFGTGVYFGHNFMPSIQTTSVLDAKKEMNEYYKGEEKSTNPRKFNTGINLDFGYFFNSNNTVTASVGYGFDGTDSNSFLRTERYNNSDRSQLNGTQIDTSYNKAQTIRGEIAFNHKFDSRPDASLNISILESSKFNGKIDRRITSGNFYPQPKNYATFSNLNDFQSKFFSSYDDLFHLGEGTLKLKAGLDFISTLDADGYSAKNYVNGQWRDSTQYAQSYLYISNSGEPYVNLTYSLGKFDFFVKERVQIYWHTMMDKLDEKRKIEDLVGLFDKVDVRNLLGAGITYRINEKNRLTADYSKSISRPDYKKLCPTLMIGNSEGEYFIGNPELQPEITDKFNLAYVYTSGILVTRLDFNYKDRRNTAEKVIDLVKSMDVTDPMVKNVYTWVNTKRQETYGSKLDFRMNGRDVKAEIWAAFNYDLFWKDEKVNKEDFNYEIGMSIDVFLNEKSKLSSSLAYISAKQSAYNLKGEDVLANLRFSRTLSKGLDLFAEFRDIVDKDLYEENWNADLNYLKVSNTANLQSMLLIGLNYRF